MITKQRLIVLFNSDVMYKRLVYTPSDLSARFCKVNLLNIKKDLIFYVGLPFRERSGLSCLCNCSGLYSIKLHFGAVQLTL